ncbi:hypothetical protein C8R47DRAFT_1327260 [Mycena vitilis]|nr:hypothetical protein C8R47DRAFT_1327260 [Mycena vitilis]
MDPVVNELTAVLPILSTRPRLGRLMSTVPFDVWAKIFRVFFRNGICCYRLGCRLREIVLHVCRSWRSVAEGCSEFWTRVQLRSCTSPECADRALTLSDRRLITIRLDLTEPRTPYKPYDTDSLLHILFQHFHRVKILTVIFGTDASFRCFQRSLLFTRLPCLRSFNVVRGCRYSRADVAPIVITWAAGTSVIMSLRLQRTAFEWARTNEFCHLRFLVLRDLGDRQAPTWPDMRTLFGAVVRLEKMCIRNVGCRDVPERPSRFPELAFLSDLDFAFGTDSSFEHVFACMQMPALHTVRFSASNDDEMLALGRSGSVLAMAKIFVFRGEFDVQLSAMRIFLNLPSLVVVDFQSMEYEMLEAMLMADTLITNRARVRSVACPNLNVIAVKNLALGLVSSFVARRSSRGNKLEQIVLDGGRRLWCDYADGRAIYLRAAVNDEGGYVPYKEPGWIHRDHSSGKIPR